ncbi:MAG TPA: hypothetical protein VMZ28_28925 [Kofleriaceae bacterium]|nr:hypothetical protein [Kofleriaceae bacterium]
MRAFATALGVIAGLALASACGSQIGDPSGTQQAADGPDGGASGAADDPDEEGTPPGPDAMPVAVTLSQSATEDITPLNSVACIEEDDAGNPVRHRENSYWRVFPIEGRIEVDEVSVGVESAADAAGAQPMSVRIHKLAGNELVLDKLTLLGSADVSVANQEAGILTVPVSASVPADSKLVVEIHVPDSAEGSTTKLFMGSNTAGQTASSYLSADACDLGDPVDLVDIGFPDVHFVMSVSGTQY